MSSQDLAKLIRSTQALIFNVSLDGRILGLNEHAAELFGGCQDGQENRNIKQLVRQSKHFDDAWAKCVASKPPFDLLQVEVTLHGHSGDSGPVLLSLLPDDSEVRILGLSLSPLEKKLIEETKSRLASLVTQELRTPLNGMVGLTTALCKSPALSAPVKKQLGVLRSSSSRLLDLVTNVMDMGDSGDSHSHNESKVNLAELLDEVVVMTNLAVDRSNVPLLKPGVQLVKSGDMDRLPLVSGDRHKLLHLLYNLVTNACKFTTVGSVTVSATHLQSGELEIVVEDTGCGISKSSLSRIFEPFQIDAARPKQVQTLQGAGLGLAVCKEIVELHHGTILAESKENEGSTLTVRLPCLPEFGQVDEMSPANRSLTPGQAAASKEKPRPVVLHVELDAKIQMFLKESLEDKYEVTGVSSIEDLLQHKDRLAKETPEIVLLDLRVPLVLCHQVCTLVRQLPRAPALLMSVENGMPTLQLEKLQESALLKPFDTDGLKKKFDTALKEPVKTRASLEQALVELMTMKSAILEHQFQEALQSEVLDSKTSKRTLCRASKKGFLSMERSERADSEIERLKQEMARLRARDLRLADHLRYQSGLNAAVLQESGTTSSSRFPVEKVNLSGLIDDVLAKVQEGQVTGMERWASRGLQNGLKDLAPIVIGNRKMIEQMVLKLLEQNATSTGSVSIVGKQLRNQSIEISLEMAAGASTRPVQSFSLHCFPGDAEKPGKVIRERPLLLAVDDEEAHQSVLRSTLGSDYEVVCRMDGKAALDWLQQQRPDQPDIVLLDTDMPGLTGFEVCKSIRETGSLSELPVILLYDKAPSTAAALEGFDSGSNDFIAKPLDPQLVREKVSSTLNEVQVVQEVQKRKIQFLEMRVSEQAAQIGRMTQGSTDADLHPELERLKLRSMQVAKRLLLQSQPFATAEVET